MACDPSSAEASPASVQPELGETGTGQPSETPPDDAMIEREDEKAQPIDHRNPSYPVREALVAAASPPEHDRESGQPTLPAASRLVLSYCLRTLPLGSLPGLSRVSFD
jgi:hypothetical protein